MTYTYATSAIGSANKQQFWTEAVSNVLFPIAPVCVNPQGFNGTLNGWHVGPSSLSYVKSDPVVYRRERRHLANDVEEEILISFSGLSDLLFTQNDRSLKVGRKQFVIQRGNVPYELRQAELNKIMVLKLPASLLAHRLRSIERYASQVAGNETFNHGGNATTAVLSAVLGYTLGLAWVALAIAVKTVATILVVARIDPGTIDHQAARGGDPGDKPAWRALFTSRPLLMLGGVAFAFQAASGALLPFIAQSLVKAGRDPSLTTGAMTVTVQVVMVGAAALVPRLARRFGHAGLLVAAMVLVALRAFLAAWSGALPVIGLIELLEGLSMGLAGVAIPALVVEVMSDSGHSNAGLGGVMTAYGAGAALSPILAGSVAQYAGFPTAFVTLGVVALLGSVFWMVGWRGSAMAPAQPAKGHPA